MKFDLTNGRRRGYVIKNNTQTVIVEFMSGCNTPVRIKRHKRKHNVEAVSRDTINAVRTFLSITENKRNPDVMWESGGFYVE